MVVRLCITDSPEELLDKMSSIYEKYPFQIIFGSIDSDYVEIISTCIILYICSY